MQITFVTGLECNDLSEGHTIYFYEFVLELVKYYPVSIICVVGGGKIFSNVNGITIFDVLKGTRYFGFFSFKNFKLVKKLNCGIIHFWYVPRLWYFPFLFRGAKYYSLPDSWSNYYYDLFKSTKNKSYLLRYVNFYFFELLLNKSSIQSIYISYQEALENNGKHVPFKINKVNVEYEIMKNGVLIGRMNSNILEELIKEVVIKNHKIIFTILTKDQKLIFKYKGIKNIIFLEWVESYAQFSSSFKVHLLYDVWGSGQSTKLINALSVGSLALGNEKAFRGFPIANNNCFFLA